MLNKNDNLILILQESQREEAEAVSLDVYLMNGHKISVNILSTDQTDDVLEVRGLRCLFLEAIPFQKVTPWVDNQKVKRGFRSNQKWPCFSC